MALETGTYISDLVATNPTSTDPKSEGDNHLRLIKSTVKATFPNVTGAVTKTHTQLNNTVDKSGDTMTGSLNIGGGGNLLVTGSGGLGYGVGAGGTVTQATSKSTAVTLNKPSGVITMNNAALGAGATVSFQCSNSLVTAGDVCLLSINFGAAVYESYNCWSRCGSGAFVVHLKNTSTGSLSEALQIPFCIIKGAAS